jgi:hypothetical protein
MSLAGGEDKVVGLVLLQHLPHPFDIIFGVSPVSLCRQVSKVQTFLLAKTNLGNRPADFSRHKRSSSSGRLDIGVIKKEKNNWSRCEL